MARVRIFVWYAAALSYLILTYPLIFLAKYFNHSKRFRLRDSLSYAIIRRLSKLMFYLSGSRIRITGRENIPGDKPVLFVCNHQGHMDGFIMQAFINRPKGFVTIKEFQRAPILRTWMKYMGCVFMDRKDMRQSLFCINEATENLNRGHSMVVFPEGKLNDGKETLQFQRGWLRMVAKSGVPIVPVTINNSHKVLSYNGKRVRAAKVECTISEPIETLGLSKDNESLFMQNLRNIILSHL